MRVVSGSARGVRLSAPRGFDVRPTGGMVKQAVFNIIRPGLGGARVLDLFSGTGQLGIEALSCGAESCAFVDSSRASLEATRKNVAAARFDARAELVLSDALAYVRRAGRFDVVFLDPPYGGGLLLPALEEIIEFDILKERGIIVCESRAAFPMPEAPPPYGKLREYKYGGVKITIYSKEVTV
jgi:16S rRNA (guanine(966)-N(2))-methyltransferase RsmD